MPQPHDNWAKYYDYSFRKTYGPLYQKLTDDSLAAIERILQKGTVLDIGAGTGRLAIPLAKNGYQVIAVEQSSGMVIELTNNCASNQVNFPIFQCSFSEYDNGPADLALALFTVLSYSVTENELKDFLQRVGIKVSPGGFFFFDLPNRVFFEQRQLVNIDTESFKRKVELEQTIDADVYWYKEECSGVLNGEAFHYQDEFRIRYWELSFLDELLRDLGFSDTNRTFPKFNGTGSTYKLYQKR